MSSLLVDSRLATIESKLNRSQGFNRAIVLLHVWIARQQGRRALARLDEAQLADIGISDAIAAIEARRPFWRGDDGLARAMGGER